uniref:Uncharacterized protein n=1 Tax=Arundo donax TaxID=35708 RepID=A0A0A8YEZ2_ARUDO
MLLCFHLVRTDFNVLHPLLSNLQTRF